MNISFFDLQGKIAVVTGGAGVLCAAMCRELAAAGAKVAVLVDVGTVFSCSTFEQADTNPMSVKTMTIRMIVLQLIEFTIFSHRMPF